MEHLPTKSDVLERLFNCWQAKPQIENIPVDEALGRVTATALFSQHSLPVVRASRMDGIAVDARHFMRGDPDTSGWIEGVDYMRADTGDDFDDRFDAIIPIEDVAFSSDGELQLRSDLVVRAGDRVRLSGSTVREGDCIVESRVPLRPVDLAGLVQGGILRVPVIKKPVVAFIPTGSELIAPGTKPARGQNIDVNTILVENMLREMGAEPWCLPIVRDDPVRLDQALQQALQRADIVIINGGSSKGGEDYNARLLKNHGEVLCRGVAAAPGKPMCIAVLDGKPVINLPGPPLAAFYGLDWCLRGIVCHYLGIAVPQRRTVTAVLTEDLSCRKPISFLFRLAVSQQPDGSFAATPLTIGEHSALRSLCANGLYASRINDGCYPKGSKIEVELAE